MSLLVAWLIVAAAEAPPLPVSELHLNPKLGLIAQDGIFKNDEVEVQIQSIKIPSPSVARQKAATDLYNLENLYKPKNNPYQGQVSELIECGPDLRPQIESFTVLPGIQAKLLVGAVSARRSFGVCAAPELAYWGGFFQFYHSPSRSNIEVRVFLRKEQASSLRAGHAKLARISRELFR